MNMQTAVITCFKKFLTIRGRASRSEFLWFFLFNVIVGNIISFFIDVSIFGFELVSTNAPFYMLWSIITLSPLVSVTIRRLHDIKLSAWWIVYYFLFVCFTYILNFTFEETISKDSAWAVVILGAIFGIIMIAGLVSPIIVPFIKGTAGDNRFGADPLAE